MAVSNLKPALFATRISIAIFLLPWVIIKFTDPGYSNAIIGYFYGVKLPEITPMILGGVWSLLLLAFVAGFKKRISYGLVLVLHAISTLTTWNILLNPFGTGDQKDILFMAALPALGAMLLLYVMRDEDTLFSFSK